MGTECTTVTTESKTCHDYLVLPVDGHRVFQFDREYIDAVSEGFVFARPVDSVADLPANAKPGTACLVRTSGYVYIKDVEGIWTPFMTASYTDG